MKKANNRIFSLSAIFYLIFFMMTNICIAEGFSREGKGYEIYVFGQFMSGSETTGSGISLEFYDTVVGGLGGGGNISDYINLNMDFFYGFIDWTATSGGISIEDNFRLMGIDVNIDFNVLQHQITPLVTAGLGFINFSNDDIEEVTISFNTGIGVRWDITDRLIAKGMYRFTWTKLEDTNKALQFSGPNVTFGYIF